jgi:hypothetical protein
MDCEQLKIPLAPELLPSQNRGQLAKAAFVSFVHAGLQTLNNSG